jgi:hypothetical protein
MERCYFWSYHIASSKWNNQGDHLYGSNVTNMPSPRYCHSVVNLGPGRAALWAGLNGQEREGLWSGKPAAGMLGDVLVYDECSSSWRCVYVEKPWPGPRCGGALVYVPPPGGADGDGTAGAASSSSSSSSAVSSGKGSAVMPGKLVALWGTGVDEDWGPVACGSSAAGEVWELSLKGMKAVAAVCHGCREQQVGLKLCAGSCGGAVAICSKECQAQVWQAGGHKAWCRKLG